METNNGPQGSLREPSRGAGSNNGIILVPLDGSVESKVALPVARLLSGVTNLAIEVLHVTARGPHAALLRQLRLSRPKETVGMVITQVIGAPAEQIARRTAGDQVKLLVMSTRGGSTDRGDVLGPVAKRVLEEAACPVVCVRPESGPRVAQQRALRRILLPLNGTPSTMALASVAMKLAEQSGAELDVLYVAALGVRAAEEAGTFSPPRYIDQAQYEWPAWVREYLDVLCARAGECPITRRARVFLRHGEPGAEILGFAAERETDLIALEWHGHWEATHAPVLRAVLGESHCPVLMVRALP